MHRRSFLQLTVAAAATSMIAPASAAETARTFEVERTGPDQLALQWTGFGAPARLYASSDPEAPAALMRALDAPRHAQRVSAAIAVSPRPYFLIEANGARLRAAERLLPLEGGVNFRDLGGYASEDGHHVRWGQLYRSGAMNNLTLADYDYLRHLGIATVCDFRSAQERANAPTHWVGPIMPDFEATDYEMRALAPNLSAATDAESARTSFAALYVEMTSLLQPQYRSMFQQLLRRETPLAFHCSAGKDRTGVAAALILSVLGVPRPTILADYALSARYYRPAGERQGGSAAFANMSPEAASIIGGADPVVLERALAAIDAQYGGPRALVQSRYGLSDAEVDVLKQAYLE